MHLRLLAAIMPIAFSWLAATVAESTAQEILPGKTSPDVFSRSNLVAWCIVPFDAKNRSPAERAEMVKRLGLTRVAYDWRENHVAAFEEEILQYQKHGIEYFAFWATHDKAFELFAKHDLHPQIWHTAPSPAGATAEARVASAVKLLFPLVQRTAKMKCKLGLYNHGGWGGEPENLVAVCKTLREQHQADHVGIVYNLHHGHGHIRDFDEALAAMKPYLLCLNLNGMTTDGDKKGQKILPVGAGEHDVSLLKIIRDSKYTGPIGIIGHTNDDVEQRLQDNLDGLDWIVPQLNGKAPGPRPTYRTHRDATPFYRDKANLLLYLDGDGKPVPVKSLDDWQKRRAHILANMQLVMGPLPPPANKVPLDLKIEAEEKLTKVIRKKISFAVGKDDRVTGYLLLPRSTNDKRPAMLCLHQTTALGSGEPAGVGGLKNLHYALELAERGYVALAPDYPNFGGYKVDAYAKGYQSATMKGIWNHMRAVDVLQSLPEVDGERIGCIGHSLGGHNALFVAAFEPRLKVIVTSCGFNSFFKYYKGNLTGWSHKGYMPRIAGEYGRDPAKMPFDFTEILGALAPRAVFINAPLQDGNFEVSGVKDCVAAATPVYKLHEAPAKLEAVYPSAGHDFPPDIREKAYAFIDRHLKPGAK